MKRLNSHKIREENYLYWPLELLTDYVQSLQEKILSRDLPAINEQFSIVSDRYRKIHPEITGVSAFFSDVANLLRSELSSDTQMYFPYIRELADCHHRNTQVAVPAFSSIINVMRLSQINHKTILKSLETVIDMTFTFNKFTLVEPSHNTLLNSLNSLEDDLQSLVHIKFNILFQRAVELENTVERNSHTHHYIQGNVA